ncbi:bifunctional hydroxymethylpyrimidine kinase/phosphomethylpyrimidine kinase [uncultured Anaerococcus sp.]|uniref:bifunctional hydroxymethylpyrimidine kinase/phosphomethylpyrimidine kinase n=1 Tax=uncultured Anaerococcus sp. TaxID=293428 RepID=UPI002616A04C|nr:bifunctional hydroxymethylpyrimidine kinase/phosphomethylpyrimidine kinase [uncultured Anaerococcus sp.]
MKNVLVLNDFVSKGKIAGRLMAPVLSYMDCEVFLLPTAMIANNFSLGGNAFFNIDPFIKESLKNWENLGIKFDLIFIGYIEDKGQKEIIKDFINNLNYKPTIVFDPIMGDDGLLYPGLDESKVNNYKDLIGLADIIIPNETEAKFLDLDIENLTESGKKIIITSAIKDEKSAVIYHDGRENIIPYDKQDIKVGGSGDLFDALFIGYLLKSFGIKEAIAKTCQDIIKIIVENEKENPGASEINIEKFLTLIEG